MFDEKRLSKKITLATIVLSSLPFFWLFTKHKYLGSVLYTTGNIAGLVGGLLFFWQMLLGIKGVINKITDDHIWKIKLHKILGKYGTLFIFAHPIIQMYAYGKNLSFTFVPNLSTEFNKNVSFGRFAFLLFIVIWITSAFLRGKLKFRPWKYIHYLAYPMVFLVIIHAKEIGSFINKYPLIEGYWSAICYGYIVLIVYKILDTLNIAKKRYIVESVVKHPGNIYVYTLRARSRKITSKPGQFVYIKSKFFGESHPFTIMEYDKRTGKLVFGIKAKGKYTKALSNLNSKDTVYVDGPYGVFTKEGQNEKPKVIIAGGVGVTPFVELVKQFGNKNTYMLNANKKLEHAIKRKMFKDKLDGRYFDFLSRETKNFPTGKRKNKNIISSRINKGNLSKLLKKDVLLGANFFICGNDQFIKDLRNMLLDLGVSGEKIFYEEFGF